MSELTTIPRTVPPGTSPREVPRSAALAPALLRAMRPKQWVKNLLVVAAPGAAGVLLHRDVISRTALALAAFCLLASATYLVNDVLDADSDRLHPAKRHRPVASGELPEAVAVVAAIVLSTAGLAVGAVLGVRFVLIAVVYLALTLAYSLAMKREPVLDVAAVAACYVLRALAGGAATGVRISPWFLILTSSAALFVVTGKRLADHVDHPPTGDGAGGHAAYPLAYLRDVWLLAAGIAIAGYCLWAFDIPHLVDGVAWSEISIVPFALGVLRYALAIEQGRGGSPEDILFRDRPLQLIGVLWLVVYVIGVYAR